MDKQLITNYIDSLKLHVGTKTTDIVLHNFLKDVYELLFVIVHDISEKEQDLWLEDSIDCEEATSDMMDILENTKEYLETRIKEKNTPWMDNLLRSLVDQLEWLMGTAKGFSKDED